MKEQEKKTLATQLIKGLQTQDGALECLCMLTHWRIQQFHAAGSASFGT